MKNNSYLFVITLFLWLISNQVKGDGPITFDFWVDVQGPSPFLLLSDTNFGTKWKFNNGEVCMWCLSISTTIQTISHHPFVIEQNDSSNRLYLDSENRIGINTSTPLTTIDAIGDSIRIRRTHSPLSDTLNMSVIEGLASLTANSTLEISSGSGTDIHMLPGIDRGVGIGTQDPQAKLDIEGDMRAFFSGENLSGDGLSKTAKLSASNTAVGKSSDVGFSLANIKAGFQWNFRTFEGSDGFSATKEGTGGAEMVISNLTNDYRNVSIQMGNGAVLTSNGNWLNASSGEYKEEIEDITANEAMMALNAINPVKYKYKRDVHKELKLGFIAEDVPDLVATKGGKNLDAMEILAMLTKVIQEQQKTISEQRSLIDDQRKLTLYLLTEMNSIKQTIKLQNMVSTAELINN